MQCFVWGDQVVNHTRSSQLVTGIFPEEVSHCPSVCNCQVIDSADVEKVFASLIE